jgi:aspartate carbamoyltransferase regulatory subunit
MREFKIVPIRNGTVLDHIEPGKSLAILQALGHPVRGSSKVVSLSMHLPSERCGHKDVLKLEDLELGDDEIAIVRGITKRGTLVVIRNYDVVAKQRWGLE